MPDLQDTLFRWTIGQPSITGLVLLAAGLLYGFFGFRFFRLLLVGTCGFVGLLAGGLVAEAYDLPAGLASLAGAAALFAAALAWKKLGVLIAATATWFVLGMYVTQRLGFEPLLTLVLSVVCGGLGLMFAWLCQRSMSVVLTTQQGAALIILGFVGVTNTFAPSIGTTFLSWAADWSLLVPVLLVMVFVTGYSYQTMIMQGDIRSGA